MRRLSIPLLFLTTLLLAVCFFCPPLAAQRRPVVDPFPDDDDLGSTRARSFSISGGVSDSQSGLRIGGVRVDLESFTQGILATAFTSSDGNFQFNNIHAGTYELVVEQTGYEEMHANVDVDAPVFGLLVKLRKLNGGTPGGPPIVSVRELSIPQKARDAMTKGMALLYQKSDYPGSIKQFQRAIEAFPNFYEAYAQIGVAYMRMKDPAHSEEALRKSITLSEGHYPDGLFLLAALFSDQDRFTDAEPLARKAVDLDPNSWHAQSEMAHALFGLQRPDEAEKYGQAAVKLQPDNPVLRLALANIHIALQNDAALLDDLNGYLKLAPNGPFAAQVRQQRDEIQQRLQKSEASPAPASPAPASPAPTQSNP